MIIIAGFCFIYLVRHRVSLGNNKFARKSHSGALCSIVKSSNLLVWHVGDDAV